jgi:hypothetical protein
MLSCPPYLHAGTAQLIHDGKNHSRSGFVSESEAGEYWNGLALKFGRTQDLNPVQCTAAEPPADVAPAAKRVKTDAIIAPAPRAAPAALVPAVAVPAVATAADAATGAGAELRTATPAESKKQSCRVM